MIYLKTNHQQPAIYFTNLTVENVICCFTREDNFQKQKVKIFFNFLLEYCWKI